MSPQIQLRFGEHCYPSFTDFPIAHTTTTTTYNNDDDVMMMTKMDNATTTTDNNDNKDKGLVHLR